MKKTAIIIIACLAVAGTAFAQVTEEWVARYNGPASNHDYVHAMAIDEEGNVYVTGVTVPYLTMGGAEHETVMYNSDGEEQWIARYDGPGWGENHANDVAVDDAGNVYITGGLDLEVIYYDEGDYATIKYNSDGEEEWVAIYDSPENGYDEAYAMAIDDDGNVYVTGESNGNFATIKYNSDGEEEWIAIYDGPESDYGEAYAIAVDGTGNVYVTGQSSYDYVTVKYNPSGTEKWVARYDGPANYGDSPTDISIDDAGNIYVTGYSSGGSEFSRDDYATIKYDSTGNELWVARYDGQDSKEDRAKAIATDGSGNVYVTGYTDYSYELSSADYTTVKYNSEGEEQWVSRYDGPEGDDDYACDLKVDGSGDIYVTGYSTGSEPDSSYDFATVRYNSQGVEQWVTRYANGSARAIAVDGAGNVYVAGNYEGTGPYDSDYATVKYNSEGIEQWVTLCEGPLSGNDVPKAMAIDLDNNIYVTGFCASPESGSRDFATVKYNSAGIEQWVVRYDGPANERDIAYAITVDNAGNVYVTGSSEGLESYYNYATVKYNTSGEEQWVARYDEPENGWGQGAYAIAVDEEGNVYVTGSSEGSGTENDYVTIKYNMAGEEQWKTRYDGPASLDDGASDIALDDAGNVYVTGYSTGSEIDSNYDYATVKYNSEGFEQWVARYDGPVSGDDFPSDLTVDGSGNIYVTGTSVGSGTGRDYTTIKYSQSGEEQWSVRFNGQANFDDFGRDIAVDDVGNAYITGSSTGSGTGEDYATIKYTTSGELLWVARHEGSAGGDDKAYAMTVDAAGNVYVTGSTDFFHELDTRDYTTIKYNTSGVKQWVIRYDGPGSGGDVALDIALDNVDNVYVTGWSLGLGGYGDDFATIKYSQGPGVAEAPVTSPIQLTSTLNRLAYDVPTEAQLTLYSVDGRKALEETVEGKGTWTPASLPTGVYFAKLSTGVYSVRKKMIVLR
ncbi:T9SS type A sorting domain-containing protein [candidate division WOR-3 bacterium]|nr:T9SS type A sorting domain-containing protein [candidate division WOR-3 bacterium]